MARHNMRTVVSFEVNRTLTRKRFWIATLIVPVLMGAVIALIVLSSTSIAAQTDSQARAEFSFTYSDPSGYVEPTVATAFGGRLTTDEAEAIATVKSGKVDAHFAYPANPAQEPTRVYGVDAGVFENGKYAAVATSMLVSSARSRIEDTALAALAQGDFQVDTATYKEGHQSSGMREVIPPLLFLVIFYASVLLLGNQMATSLLEEKESRVSEMILTTMDPTTLVTGKVAAMFIIGFVQMVALALPVAVGYLFFRTELSLPFVDLSHLVFKPGPMIVGALLLVGGFSLFTMTMTAAGAIMPTARDAGQISAPLTVMTFVPLWALSTVIASPQSFIVQVLTHFPYTAPVTAMLRNGLGTLTPVAAAIVVAELFATTYVVFRIAVRVFRYGSIEYTQKVPLRAGLAKRD